MPLFIIYVHRYAKNVMHFFPFSVLYFFFFRINKDFSPVYVKEETEEEKNMLSECQPLRRTNWRVGGISNRWSLTYFTQVV
jgi:hypothetical protein